MLQSRVTNFTFPARRSTTIRTVKEKLADFTGHAATHQRVLARGFELNNIDRVGSRTALDVVPHSPPRSHNILTGQVQNPATSCLCVFVIRAYLRVNACVSMHACNSTPAKQSLVYTGRFAVWAHENSRFQRKERQGEEGSRSSPQPERNATGGGRDGRGH